MHAPILFNSRSPREVFQADNPAPKQPELQGGNIPIGTSNAATFNTEKGVGISSDVPTTGEPPRVFIDVDDLPTPPPSPQVDSSADPISDKCEKLERSIYDVGENAKTDLDSLVA